MTELLTKTKCYVFTDHSHSVKHAYTAMYKAA